MQVFLLDGLGRPMRANATRVLICTDAGTPTALAVELLAAPSLIDVSDSGDPDFNTKLRTHGIHGSVQVGSVTPPRVDDFGLTSCYR